MKQSKYLILLQKLAENLRDFEIGPSNDLVCQNIYMSRVYLELSPETSTRKLYTDVLQ